MAQSLRSAILLKWSRLTLRLIPLRRLNGGWICVLPWQTSPKMTLTTSFSYKWLSQVPFALPSPTADRLNKRQWADENRKTSLSSCTNSICFAPCGCTWPPFFYFICSSVLSCPLTIWVIIKFPALWSFFSQHFPRVSIKAINKCLDN